MTLLLIVIASIIAAGTVSRAFVLGPARRRAEDDHAARARQIEMIRRRQAHLAAGLGTPTRRARPRLPVGPGEEALDAVGRMRTTATTGG